MTRHDRTSEFASMFIFFGAGTPLTGNLRTSSPRVCTAGLGQSWLLLDGLLGVKPTACP